jgi:LysM repeat protein
MMRAMDLTARTLALLLLVPLFTQCGYKSAPSSSSVTGPFDSRGNYVEDWVDKPDQWYRPPTPGSAPTRSKKNLAANTEQSQTQVSAARPDPAPVVVKAKPKPKPKPKPSFAYHKVRRGDTLSALSRRYSTSISSIQRANGISGTVIRLGETLKIPK